MYIDFDKENSKENPKFKIGNNVRISKCKSIFCTRLCSKLVKKVLWLKTLKQDDTNICY